MLTEDIMYQALLNKDAAFVGLFFTAVKTTRIFCHPTCTAKKPKRENVEFFKTAEAALAHGYRPCKVCFPLKNPNEAPDDIKRVLDEIHANPLQIIKNSDLPARGIEPNRMRRWFQQHYGFTFQAYQRMIRMNTAFKKIQNGAKTTDAAFESGYESLSGFNDSFKFIFGSSPTQSKHKQIIDLARLETPLGPMFAGATAEGLCLLEFTDRRMLKTEMKQLAKYLNAIFVPGTNAHLTTLERELSAYFSGTRKAFSVPLLAPGTDFQQAVWAELRRIPYGTTRSYRQQAEALNNPQAVRAVASANGMNKIAIIVPCHRVIGSNGQMTGYGGGVWRKKWLLELEEKYTVVSG